MKISLIFVLLLPQFAFSATDWNRPPIACVEEIVPEKPADCLDLTTVADPTKDFPANFTESDIAAWRLKRRTLTVCRYLEVARREKENPGHQNPDALKVSWMIQNAIDEREQKIAAVYKASRDLKLPYTILAGALRQESMFADLGISPDGNNYSCGIGQFNIIGWCNWVSKQSSEVRAQLNWPNISCADLTPALMKPFYDIAVTKLGTIPDYKMNWEQFKTIGFSQVQNSLGAGSRPVLLNRYQASMSFAQNCINPIYGIQAKANEIAKIYSEFIPAGFKQVQKYLPGEPWPADCREKGYEGVYPFQIGWLMAVAMYNAGPRVLNPLTYYWGWDNNDVVNPNIFLNVTPLELVEGLYWGGKYNKATDEVNFKTLAGVTSQASWYKMCVVQRHIARVVQNSTRSGVAPLVDNLEGSSGCFPATRDAAGNIMTSAPLARQNSSGVKQ